MKYKEKGEEKLQRERIAQELTKLAGLIADGDIGTLEHEILLADQGVIKWKHKVDKDRFSSEIEINIPVQGKIESLETRFSAFGPDKKHGKKEGARPSVNRTGKRPEGRKNGTRNSNSRKKRPYKARKVKKAIKGLWQEIKDCAQSNKAFPPDNAARFYDLINQYGQMADPQWKDDWTECASSMKSAITALKSGDPGGVARAIENAEQLTKQCHAKHKKS